VYFDRLCYGDEMGQTNSTVLSRAELGGIRRDWEEELSTLMQQACDERWDVSVPVSVFVHERWAWES
jgi:sulfopyruvate decarboxylase TPP-binding subunit